MDVIEAVCDRVIVLSEGDIVADDSIENLLDVFQTQSYRVQLAEEPPAQVRDRLDARFQLLDWRATADQMAFDIALGGSDEFYDCVDVLRTAGLTVQSFTEIDPDLEEVFVTLTAESSATEETL